MPLPCARRGSLHPVSRKTRLPGGSNPEPHSASHNTLPLKQALPPPIAGACRSPFRGSFRAQTSLRGKAPHVRERRNRNRRKRRNLPGLHPTGPRAPGTSVAGQSRRAANPPGSRPPDGLCFRKLRARESGKSVREHLRALRGGSATFALSPSDACPVFLHPQFRHGCSRPTFILWRFDDRLHVRMLLEVPAEGLAQDPHSAAMNNSHARQAGQESAIEELFHLASGVIHVVADDIDLGRNIVGRVGERNRYAFGARSTNRSLGSAGDHFGDVVPRNPHFHRTYGNLKMTVVEAASGSGIPAHGF